MVPELGHFFLCFSVVLGTFCPFVTLFLELYQKGAGSLWGRRSFDACALGISVSFFSLLWSYGVSDLSVLNVLMNSHPQNPLIYRLGALWGNHEGSMLLWALMIALYGSFFHHGEKRDSSWVTWTLLIHSFLLSVFLWFIVFTSNPFERFFPVPTKGLGLNPLLQDPSLTIHPPLLYAGYVGYSLLFSLTLGQKISGQRDWGVLRRWSLGIWSLLTIGIGLGAWWAYYTLGWGGWWFWDPVENASLFPWLAGLGFLHLLKGKDLEKKDTLLFIGGVLPFLMTVLGTILVRSGIVVSVHAFAKDPKRGFFLLLLWGGLVAACVSIGLMKKGKRNFLEENLSWTEKLLGIAPFFFFAGLVLVLIGTLYPVFFMLMTGDELIISPFYYHITFLPLMGVGCVFMGVVPWISIQGRFSRVFFEQIIMPAGVGVLAVLMVLLWQHVSPFLLSSLGYGVGIWVILTTLSLFRKKLWGVSVSHLGVGIFILGMTGQSLGKEQEIGLLPLGGRLCLKAYEIILEEVERGETPSYKFERACLRIQPHGSEEKKKGFFLYPEVRLYKIPEKITLQTALQSWRGGDIYVALGEKRPDGKWPVYGAYYPFMVFLWMGIGLMAWGAGIQSFLCFSRKRKKNP